MLFAAGQCRNFHIAQVPQRVDDVLHQHLWRGSASGNTDGLRILNPRRRELAAVGDEIARNAGLGADLA
jgi:hypothetical protein